MTTDEGRSAQRQRTLKGAKIVFNENFSTFDCVVRNLSTTGAKLKIASSVGVPERFVLAFDDGRKFDCAVAWRREDEIGVKFE